jgi:hypothetical protein
LVSSPAITTTAQQPQEEKMTESVPTLSRHDLEAKIVKRCWEDEAFRKEFTGDPAGAFTRYLNVPAKDIPKIVVFEETAGSWHIVVPPRPAYAGELAEIDLERVAGGTSGAVVSNIIENADEVAKLSEVLTGVAARLPHLASGAASGAGTVAGVLVSIKEGPGW